MLKQIRDQLRYLLRPQRGFGYQPDRPDDRDYRLRELKLSGDIPEAASLLSAPITIKDQMASSSCPGQSVAQAVRLAYNASLGMEAVCPDLSALFVYFNARMEDGTGMGDDGATLRGAIKSLQRSGVCPEDKWAFALSRVNREPDWKARRAAHDRRGIRGYYRIDDGDVVGVKTCVAKKVPVVGGWEVNEAFRRYNGSYVLGKLSAPFIGRHAMVIAAYDSRASTVMKYGSSRNTLINSWGTDHGDNGLIYADDEFIGQARDLWAIDV